MSKPTDILTYCEALMDIVKQFRRLDHEARLRVLKQLTEEDANLGVTPFAALERQFNEEKATGVIPNKINYIKAVRQASIMADNNNLPTYGLKEAKDLVESW